MSADQQTEAERIAARIRKLVAELPPPDPARAAFLAAMPPEKIAETIATLPEESRARIFAIHPEIRP
jgi:hypothetical protein